LTENGQLPDNFTDRYDSDNNDEDSKEEDLPPNLLAQVLAAIES
jgi:hypothetical protein